MARKLLAAFKNLNLYFWKNVTVVQMTRNIRGKLNTKYYLQFDALALIWVKWWVSRMPYDGFDWIANKTNRRKNTKNQFQDDDDDDEEHVFLRVYFLSNIFLNVWTFRNT